MDRLTHSRTDKQTERQANRRADTLPGKTGQKDMQNTSKPDREKHRKTGLGTGTWEWGRESPVLIV